jgi:transposase
MENANQNRINTQNYSDLSASDIRAVLFEQDKTLTEQQSLLNSQEKHIQTLTLKLNWFEEQFKLLKSKHYAKSSETHTSVQYQLELFDEDDEVTQQENPHADASNTETITYTRTKPNRHSKNVDTSKLPRERHLIELDEQEQQCSCGHDLEAFGEEIKEELVFKPATLKVIEHVRVKYTCRHCETIKMPKAVELPLSKSKAGASLLADIIINKYDYHLPLYRQSKAFATYQITIPDNTLGGWVMGAAEKLEPLGTAYWNELNTIEALQVDDFIPIYNTLMPRPKACWGLL